MAKRVFTDKIVTDDIFGTNGYHPAEVLFEDTYDFRVDICSQNWGAKPAANQYKAAYKMQGVDLWPSMKCEEWFDGSRVFMITEFTYIILNIIIYNRHIQ